LCVWIGGEVNRTKIPWCDWTWNPIVGCSPASKGCANCYAAAISKRFHLPWGSAHFAPERLDQLGKVRKPGRVFVCSMADIGHETVKPEWRQAVYAAMRSAPWHTFIILTKRPGAWLRDVPRPAWIGVTAEDQSNYEARWLELTAHVQGPGHALRFVSVEPMLGPVTLSGDWCDPDWVIAGPENGPKARRCEDAWIDALAAESPCFFDKRDRWTRREFPTHNAAGQTPAAHKETV
jgi:protein gp37